jgi:3-oxo-5alpha-steroid 4-dehydrogenase
VNEDAYQTVAGEIGLRAEDGQVYLLVDDEIYERPFPPVEFMAVGETIEAVEREAGLPAGILQQTVATYNAHAEKGEDPLFHKTAEFLKPLTKPPFGLLDYRVETALWSVFTMGGLRTSVDGEVLTADGDTVPGLFAAGRTTSGLAAQGYSSGLSLADATFFGRRAGQAAASRSSR